MSDDRKIILEEFELLHTSTSADFGAGAAAVGAKGQRIKSHFEQRLKIVVVKKPDPNELEFDMIGVDPSFANALRRIILSDVPSMAIEKVHIYNNTSIIQDEVLAHRLGLIPLKADARLFKWKKPLPAPAATTSAADPDQQVSQDRGEVRDTLEFELKVRCRRNPQAPSGATNANDLYLNVNVYSKDIVWVPKPGQEEFIKDQPGPVLDDILIAKLRPGHEIDVKLFAVKGTGRDHAKFSPVATAYYRLHPDIELTRPVYDEAAQNLQSCFSPGVIELQECQEDGHHTRAVVGKARYDACSRNVFRYADLSGCVKMAKVRDHFIFNVESVGAQQPEVIVEQAIQILAQKCDYFLKELDM